MRGRIQDGNSNTRNRSVKSVELATQTEELEEQSVAWVFDTWVGTSLFVLPVPEEDSSCSCSGGCVLKLLNHQTDTPWKGKKVLW